MWNAKANLGETVRQVKQYFERAQLARAQLVLRKADLLKAQLDLKRRVGLIGNRAVSKEELQHYQTAFDAAEAQYDTAAHELASALSLVDHTTLYHHPLVEQAKSQLRQAYLNWERAAILAPVTGFVAKRNAEVGQQVTMGSALLAIIPLSEVWVDANYKESQLERIRIDQPVTLAVDAYPGITFHGTVQGLDSGTGSAFSLLPPQNATGNWIKIVQRLPVRIKLDQKELRDYPLRIGLSVRVTVNTHNLKGKVLPQTPNKRPVYVTDVYANMVSNADTVIQSILTTNASDMSLPPDQAKAAVKTPLYSFRSSASFYPLPHFSNVRA
jgi:membrane fusion protein, multidrug efflux system